VIPIGIGDGVGGADFILEDGTKEYWPPSKLRGAWMTTPQGMEKFAAWCYQINAKHARAGMRDYEKRISK
jgi:hypothetical protein